MEREASPTTSDIEEITISDIFELSKTTTVEWIGGGQLLICRRKRRYDGTLSPFPYEVYVNPEACTAILDKQQQIDTTMSCIKSQQLSSPTNVDLGGGRVLQCSLFNGAPKYGIHILENDKIARRRGCNLSTDEYRQLINFLCYSPPVVPNPIGTVFTLTQYSYQWTPKNPAINGSISDGCWYIFPEICIKEAENDKPISEDYELTLSSRKTVHPINDDLIDAAAAKLIIHHIELEKNRESMENTLCEYYDEPGNDLLAYGPRVRQLITLTEIFNLLMKVITMSEHSECEIKALICAIVKRGNHPDALENLTKGKLNPSCVNLLLDATL